MSNVILKPGRDKPVRQRHPWIFGGAIERVEAAADGDVVEVITREGEWLARGYLNRRSQIVVRLLTWDQSVPIDDAFWRSRLSRSISARPYGPARRLVNAEADGLPGLVVDQYGEWLVMQALTLGLDRRKDLIAPLLAELVQPRGIYERSDVDVRAKEGLMSATGVAWGDEPPARIKIEEHGLHFWVDVQRGHKTGFYLDQRDNRLKIRPYVREAEVLNLFSFSGGFAVAALAAGAQRVINVDSSAEALTLAKENYRLNDLPVQDADFVEADVFSYLRKLRAGQRRFDVIIADPPKLAQAQSQIDRAARAYKDLNLVSMQLLKPGGYLITFSCSGVVSSDLFQKIVFGAAVDAKRDVQIVERLSQAGDHPVLLSFPESEYLKGLVCRVL
jgi:23S rRNA (cytosine1962-C5)-methyltransferase